MNSRHGKNNLIGKLSGKGLICTILLILLSTLGVFAQDAIRSKGHSFHQPVIAPTDSTERSQLPKYRQPGFIPEVVPIDSFTNEVDSVAVVTDSITERVTLNADTLNITRLPEENVRIFTPDPTRAVWLSALFPGLGQVYNRRYWKLPIVVGAYMGLGYATSWNNRMLSDYTRAYRDIMDTDPTTKSYMDFFPSTTKEEDLDKSWLTNTLKSRKNYFRQNRDLCIICMVGVYFLAMIDAYVDASLSQFDISPDLSMQVSPTLIQDSRDKLPAVGVHWAFCF